MVLYVNLRRIDIQLSINCSFVFSLGSSMTQYRNVVLVLLASKKIDEVYKIEAVMWSAAGIFTPTGMSSMSPLITSKYLQSFSSVFTLHKVLLNETLNYRLQKISSASCLRY